MRFEARTRILHVVDNLGRGGMQNGLINLIDRLDADQFEHIVCSTRYLEQTKAHQLPTDRARIICIAKQGGNARIQVPALIRTIRDSKPHIVHSRNWGGVEAVIAGRWVGFPALVHSEHGFDKDPAAAEPWRRRYFRRLVFELANRVVCVSDQLKQVHAKRTGFAEKRISVIHNGVDTSRFSPNLASRMSMRKELGLGDEEFCIGCVGNLTAVKDYPTMLRAAGEIFKSIKNWRLVVIGEGPERSRMEDIVREQPNWGRRVLFPGLSGRVSELLNAMDAYVLSSITEGISNSLLEAMATGLPVIVTATGGNPEVVMDNESGMLFPVGDWRLLAQHLLALQAQQELRSRLGKEALLRVRTSFSLETMVRKYEQLYQSLIPRPDARPRAVAEPS